MRGIQDHLRHHLGLQEHLDQEWEWARLALEVPQGAHMNWKLNVSGTILQGVLGGWVLART